MNSNNDIQDPSFLELIKAFESGLIHEGPPPVAEFRLYYDEDGRIVRSTTTLREAEELNIPLPYLIVDNEQYQIFYRFKVENGQLVEISQSSGQRVQLKKSTKGFKVVENHAAILLEADDDYPNTEYYDYRNN